MATQRGEGRKGPQWNLSSTTIDLAIGQLASRQHGNVTREQLLALGAGVQAVKYRLRIGRLHREHRGVYAVGRPAGTPLERASAALLACGRNTSLSHAWALALWGLRAGWPEGAVEVIVAGDRRPPGIEVHRCRTLTPADVCRREGLAVTSPARTLLDCAPRLSDRALARAVNDALRRGLLRRSELAKLVARCPSHPGIRRLRPHVDATANPTRSAFEDDFLAFCTRFALPTPRINVRVAGREVDAYFPAERVIVECDGWDFHRDRNAFESDRDHDATALALGIVTVRITWGRLHDEPHREAERLGTILARRGHAAA